MHLKALYLYHFRNYKELFIPFCEHINLIVGENAQGKTNLLEAIYFLVTGRSFRTHRLSDLIYFGAKEFYLEAHFQKDEVDQVLKIQCDGEQRKIIYNTTSLKSLSALLGIFLGVIFSPEDNELIKGNPSVRRQFLDFQIAQTNPLYFHHLARYNKAMKHRNSLLKNKDLKTIEIWENAMANSAAYITVARQKITTELQQESHLLQNLFSANNDEVHLKYESPALKTSHAEIEYISNYYIQQFAKIRKRELEMGVTLVGPHKDDMSIYLQNKPARHFASEGQQRSLIAALKLAEWRRLVRLTYEKPLFCIDDLGISLDKFREEYLYKHLGELGQVFITTARLSSLPFTHYQIFRIQQGQLNLE